MSIKLGTQNIVGLYKGNTEIIKRYKGNNLVYESFLPYSFEYLYNSFIPTAINNKIVNDKLRLTKIYANAVIENQLNNPTPISQTINGLVFINNGDGSFTVNGTATDDTVKSVGAIFSIISGHYYLICGGASGGSNSTYRLLEGYTYRWFDTNGNGHIQNATASGNAGLIIDIKSGTTCNNLVFKPQFIDLTLMYGPGNEPTSLTDNRIQALLNQGYIEYNAGTYKGTNIGEFVSAPYNLLSLDRTTGTLNGGSYTKGNAQDFKENKYYAGLAVNDYVHQAAVTNVSISGEAISFTSNSAAYGLALPIKVIAGRAYTLEKTGTNAGTCYVAWYDQNGLFISSNVADNNVSNTAPNNACWSVIVLRVTSDGATATYSNVCLHLTGTRTGYAPHTQPYTLPFKYQGNSALNAHDRLEITDTEYVFTKNISNIVYDGSEDESWQEYGSGSQRFTILNNLWSSPSSSTVANILCNKLQTYAKNEIFNKEYAISGSDDNVNYFIVRINSSITDVTALKTWLSNNPINVNYELVTPQVTRIPRKHLAVVDLGTLTWGSVANYGAYSSSLNQLAKKPANNNTTPNIYCSKYTSSYRSQYGLNNRMLITIDQTGDLDIEQSDLIGLTNKQIQSLLGGTYLFYETQDEVTDIISDIDIEAGGTLTSNWFSWVENQLVANGNFETNASGWGALQGTNSVSDNTLTFTAANTVTNTGCYTQVLANGTTANHKYLVSAKIKASVSTTTTRIVFDGVYNDNPIFPLTADTWLDFSRIYSVSTPNTSTGVKGYLYFYYSLSGEEVASGSTLSVKKVMCIDLTLAFGAGKEPTSVNDPRIQYIIKQGYIPTNTTGTTKSIASEVLPNIDASFNRK